MQWRFVLYLNLLAILAFFNPYQSTAQEYTLGDILRVGIENSERVKISAENITIAEMGKRKAFSVLVPHLTAFGTFTQFNDDNTMNLGGLLLVSQPDHQTTWGLRLDQAITMNGREVTAFNMAKDNIEKNRFDHQAVREDYLLAIAAAFFDVLKAQRSLEISEVNLKRVTAYRNAARTRFKVGEVTKTVLLRAEGELSGALSDQIRARNGLELARAVLARRVGIPEGFTLKEEKLEAQEGISLAQFLDKALAQRAELKSLDTQKKMAGEQLQYAKGAFWPQLGLSAVYSGADQGPMGFSFTKESKYVGASINFPLFEGGLRSADVQEAGSKLKQSELAYHNTARDIRVEVQNAYLDLGTQKGTLRYLEDQLTFARDNYNAVTRQFEFGLANHLDVLDANNLLLSAERQLADASYNYQMAIMRIRRTTGGLQDFVSAVKQDK